jgi:hypothetical protein
MNLMRNQIKQELGCKVEDSFFKPFDKKIMFNGFKMFNFRCLGHMCKK